MLAARQLAAAGGRLFSAAASSASARGGHAGSAAGSGDTLGKRLLKLIYPKRSAVVVLRQWAEEGRTVQKHQLRRVVRELRKYGRFKHALEVHRPTLATCRVSTANAIAIRRSGYRLLLAACSTYCQHDS